MEVPCMYAFLLPNGKFWRWNNTTRTYVNFGKALQAFNEECKIGYIPYGTKLVKLVMTEVLQTKMEEAPYEI